MVVTPFRTHSSLSR